IEELGKTLDSLVLKGSIFSSEKDGKKLYSYAQFAIGMFEFQVDRMTKEFAQDSEEYAKGEFSKEFHNTKIPQLRVVPVNRSITPKLNVATYDDIREVIKSKAGLFGVRNCVCRQVRDLLEDPCKNTDIRETCLTFPSASTIFNKYKPDRHITKEEALEILQRAEDAGLVIQPGNTQDPEFICCCCSDCCGVLTTAKLFPKPAELFASNYFAQIDPELCSACKRCLKKCQMNALEIENEVCSIDRNKCIGCGLCVSSCPDNAIYLKKKTKEMVPPKSTSTLYRKILVRKHGNWAMFKMVLKNREMLKTGIKSLFRTK
ncbi:MAG: 4Fe-4S binding protein, partial [Promethearchaeota archaeon]